MRRTIWSCALSCRVWVLCAYLFFFVQPSPPKDEGFLRSPIYCDPSQLPLLCSSIYDILTELLYWLHPQGERLHIWITIYTMKLFHATSYWKGEPTLLVIYGLVQDAVLKVISNFPSNSPFTFSYGIGCLCITLSFHPTTSSATPSLRLHLCLHTCHLLKSRCVP